MVKKINFFWVLFLLILLHYTYSFTDKDLLSLISPLKLKQKFINNFVVLSIYSEKQQDILIKIQNIKTNRNLLLWLIKKDNNVPYFKQTNNYNIQCIFLSEPYNLNEEEKKAIEVIIDKIKINDVGKIQLIKKTNPQIIDLEKNKNLEKKLGIKRIPGLAKTEKKLWKFKIPLENTMLLFIFIIMFFTLMIKVISRVLKKK